MSDAAAPDPRIPPAPISGRYDPRFAAVAAAFRENFTARDEIGGAVCVRVDGREVVDLWGGYADSTRARPWTRDTLVNAYSVGKGVAAMLALSLVERGELDLDAPVARLWPAFGVEGKANASLRTLLAHRAGLPGLRRPLPPEAAFDWDVLCEALAAQRPYWTPGEAHGYHVNTFGFLVGEPIRRRLGLSFGEALRRRLCGPTGADFHVGLPHADHRRVARIVEPTRPTRMQLENDPSPEERRAIAARQLGGRDDDTNAMLADVYFNPPGLSGVGTVNTAPWRRAAIPSTNGHGTARAVAALYDRFLRLDPSDGGFVGPGLRAEATRIASDGEDRVLGKPSRFGLGFQLSQPTRRIGRGEGCFGHFGYGGTLGFADPESGVAFAYLMNRPGERWQTPRTNALVEAVYEALGVSLPPTERAR